MSRNGPGAWDFPFPRGPTRPRAARLASAPKVDVYAHGRHISLLGPTAAVADVAVVLSDRIRQCQPSLTMGDDATDAARIRARA